MSKDQNKSEDRLQEIEQFAGSRITLHFDDWETESEFRWYHVQQSLYLVRLTVPVLCLAIIGFGIGDAIIRVDPIRLRCLIIRLCIQLPLTIAFIVYSSLHAYVAKRGAFVQLSNAALALILGIGNVALSVVGQQPDHGPHMLFFFVVYFFLQLRVLYATGVCWGIIISFAVGVPIWVPGYDRLKLAMGYMILANFALMIACYVIEYWSRLNFVRHMMQSREKERTIELLNDLLPARITQQLQILGDGDHLIAEELNNITILFSDIVGFTAYSASIRASELVRFLNVLYTMFDGLTELHEVLKIETIGDAYFVASGVVIEREDHAELMANMAFDMQYTINELKLPDGYKPHIRIGLHTGRVIAGVVGVKVPRYHLFGDSVTVANLMESTGKPGRIQVSDALHGLLSDTPGYILHPRKSPVDLGEPRGLMQTYWLLPDPECPVRSIRDPPIPVMEEGGEGGEAAMY